MAGFVLALFTVIGMLVTAVLVMNLASASKLNDGIAYTLRIGFSLLAGWLTVVTILGVCFVLKSAGFNETEKDIDES